MAGFKYFLDFSFTPKIIWGEDWRWFPFWGAYSFKWVGSTTNQTTDGKLSDYFCYIDGKIWDMNRYDDMIPPFQESVVSWFWRNFSGGLVLVSFGVYCQTHVAYARATQVYAETCWHRPVGWAYEPLGPGWWDGRMARWWVIGFHCSSAFIQKRSLADCGLMIILPYHSDLPSYYHRVLLICIYI